MSIIYRMLLRKSTILVGITFLLTTLNVTLLGSFAAIALVIILPSLIIISLSGRDENLHTPGVYIIPSLALAVFSVFLIGNLLKTSIRTTFHIYSIILLLVWFIVSIYKGQCERRFRYHYPPWFYISGISVSVILFLVLGDWPINSFSQPTFDEILIKQGTIIRSISQHGLPAVNPYLTSAGNSDTVPLFYYYSYLAFCSAVQQAGAIPYLNAYALVNIILFLGFMFLVFDYASALKMNRPLIVFVLFFTVFSYGFSIMGNFADILICQNCELSIKSLLIGQQWSPITGLHISPTFQTTMNAPQHLLPTLLIIWLSWMIGCGLINKFWKIQICLFCLAALPTLSPYVSFSGIPIGLTMLFVCLFDYYRNLSGNFYSKTVLVALCILVYITASVPALAGYLKAGHGVGSIHIGIASFGPHWFTFIPFWGRMLDLAAFFVIPLSPAILFAIYKPNISLSLQEGFWTIVLCVVVGFIVHLTIYSNHPYNDVGFRSMYVSIIAIQFLAAINIQKMFSHKFFSRPSFLWVASLLLVLTVFPTGSYVSVRLVDRIFKEKVNPYLLTVEPSLISLYKWAEANLPSEDVLQGNPFVARSAQYYYSGHRALYQEQHHSRLFYSDGLAETNLAAIKKVIKIKDPVTLGKGLKDIGIDAIIVTDNSIPLNQNLRKEFPVDAKMLLNSESFSLLYKRGRYLLLKVNAVVKSEYRKVSLPTIFPKNWTEI